jgi:hypothetical protein
MSEIEIAVTNSKQLEHLLESRHGATGKGLHQKVTSIESRLPAPLVGQLRAVATLRNKVVHESGFKLPDPTKFTLDCQAALAALTELPPVAPVAPSRDFGHIAFMTWVCISVALSLALGCYVFYTTGLGAALLAALVAFVGCIWLTTDDGVALVKNVGFGILGLLALILFASAIKALWNVGKIAS